MRFILDLDDTLAQTTRDMQGDVARVSSLTLAPGVGEFIELLNSRGDFYALVTVGDEALQAEKITHLGLMFPQVVIVPKTDDPYMKSEAVAQIVDARREGEECVLIGDRLDRDISVGNALGLTTVRMCLPEGRYSAIEPQNEREKPAFTVRDFFELMKLPIFS